MARRGHAQRTNISPSGLTCWLLPRARRGMRRARDDGPDLTDGRWADGEGRSACGHGLGANGKLQLPECPARNVSLSALRNHGNGTELVWCGRFRRARPSISCQVRCCRGAEEGRSRAPRAKLRARVVNGAAVRRWQAG